MANAVSVSVENESVEIPVVTNETLMDCIPKYRCIYDKSSRDFKDKKMKRNAWDEIGLSLRTAPVTARTRYDNIRTALSKYLKSLRGRPGAGRDDVPPG